MTTVTWRSRTARALVLGLILGGVDATSAQSAMTTFAPAGAPFRLSLPATWTTELYADGSGVVAATTASALARFRAGTAEPGDVAVNVGLVPAAWFEERAFAALGVRFDVPPDALLRSILPMLRLRGDAAGAAFGDVERVHLGDGAEAGLLTVPGGARDAELLVFEASDGVIAFVTATGYPGELEGFRETALAVASSLDITAPAEVLAATFYSE